VPLLVHTAGHDRKLGHLEAAMLECAHGFLGLIEVAIDGHGRVALAFGQ